MVVVEADVAQHRLCEVLSAADAVVLQDVLDPAVEPVDHAARLRSHGRRQAMLDDAPCRAISPSDNGECSPQRRSASWAPVAGRRREAEQPVGKLLAPRRCLSGQCVPMARAVSTRAIFISAARSRPREASATHWPPSWSGRRGRRPIGGRDRSCEPVEGGARHAPPTGVVWPNCWWRAHDPGHAGPRAGHALASY
jgi:hypothetical protein